MRDSTEQSPSLCEIAPSSLLASPHTLVCHRHAPVGSDSALPQGPMATPSPSARRTWGGPFPCPQGLPTCGHGPFPWPQGLPTCGHGPFPWPQSLPTCGHGLACRGPSRVCVRCTWFNVILVKRDTGQTPVEIWPGVGSAERKKCPGRDGGGRGPAPRPCWVWKAGTAGPWPDPKSAMAMPIAEATMLAQTAGSG